MYPEEPLTYQAALPPQKPSFFRRFGMGAFTISLLVHAVFIILAVFFLFKWVYPPQEKVDFLPGGGGGGGNNGDTVTKVKTEKRMMMASNAVVRKVAVSGAASFTLPDTSTELVDPGLPMASAVVGAGSGGGSGGGHGGGNGPGIGPGTGPGAGPGNGAGFGMAITPFGSNLQRDGALKGYFYDFKQTRKGEQVPYDIANPEDFVSRVVKLEKRGFREAAFRDYYVAPEALYLTQLAIHRSPASEGPGFFGAADSVRPSGWVAHYSGTVKAPRDMTFRFVGHGDDYLVVQVKGRPRLYACWPDIQQSIAGRWTAADPEHSYPSPGGPPMLQGDWIQVRKGEALEMDIAVGERPGGLVGFLLLVQEKGVEYRKTSAGRPILPLFTTEKISAESRARIEKDFADWEFEWDKIPVFGSDAIDNPFR